MMFGYTEIYRGRQSLGLRAMKNQDNAESAGNNNGHLYRHWICVGPYLDCKLGKPR